MAARPATAPVPGDGLLHPVPLLAIAVLAVNDHVLKAAAPGLVTGKLSDIAGLAFFPTALVAAWEVMRSAARTCAAPSLRPVIVAVAATGIAFSAVKTIAAATEAYGATLGALQWPFRVVVAAVAGRPAPAPAPVTAETDPTDLVALPVLAVPLVLGARRAGARRRSRVERIAVGGACEASAEPSTAAR